MSSHRQLQQHFLIVVSPVQSHINPALHLAYRLTSIGALVTLSTSASASAHRRMLPSATSHSTDASGNLTFIPYPDSYAAFMSSQSHANTTALPDDPESYSEFSAVIVDLAARGRRVTCVIHTLLITWAADVAHKLGIPTAQYWIQPATTFATYYHYFHGHEPVISAHSNDPHFSLKLPGLPPMETRDLPTFITTTAPSGGPYARILPSFRQSFEAMDKADRSNHKILINTCEELEPEALAAVEKFHLIPIGPVLSTSTGLDLLESDHDRYIEWLNGKPEKSVVYVSFGSISVLQKKQIEELSKGLKASGRPYLWVVRKDSRDELFDENCNEDNGNGMIVEWCSQVRVLSHAAVGCFVSHCGWNSTMEGLLWGVPMVAVPQWADQGTNAMLMEKKWGTAVRGEANGDGVLEGEELERCLELVMGEGEKGREIRRNAELWRGRAREAVGEGGSSDRNLRAFVDDIAALDV